MCCFCNPPHRGRYHTIHFLLVVSYFLSRLTNQYITRNETHFCTYAASDHPLCFSCGSYGYVFRHCIQSRDSPGAIYRLLIKWRHVRFYRLVRRSECTCYLVFPPNQSRVPWLCSTNWLLVGFSVVVSRNFISTASTSYSCL